jgi:hypothetical protein
VAVQVESLIVRLRPRAPYEAADLGARLCQQAAASVYRCYLAVALPLVMLCLGSFEIAHWLPALALWCCKPWLDRTILFVLSRAAFGQPTALGELWEAQRQVWWGQLILTFTLQRLSPWRSFTQPVYQLEGLSPGEAHKRVLQIRGQSTRAATLVTSAFATAETCLTLSILSLAFWLAPVGLTPDVRAFVNGGAGIGDFMQLVPAISYALAVLFLEPFYVAAGFAMYLNRRAELEAWDIEQDLRRAFAA